MNRDVHRLLDESRWLGGLARRLVADPSSADDLVQETMVAALEAQGGPPESGVRAWLGTILRRKAIDAHRGSTRRAVRERRSAREEALPGPDELSELLESEGLLRDALAELEEPVRRTVLLRYREGLSAAEIARRDGTPAGTVRWRLKSGLDQLREGLERRDGNWAVVLAPLAKLPGTTAVGAAATLGSKGLWAAAAVSLVALGVGASYLVAGPKSKPEVERSTALAAAAEIDSQQATFELERVEPVRAPAAAGSEPDESGVAQVDPDPPVAEFAEVELRVLNSEGEPVSGATLADFTGGIQEMMGEPSGSDGRLIARVQAGASLIERREVFVRAPGLASQLLELEFRGGVLSDAGEVRLARGGSVHGYVADSGLEPGEGFVLFLHPLDESVVERIRAGARMDDLQMPLNSFNMLSELEMIDPSTGEFRLEGVPSGVPGQVLTGIEARGGAMALSDVIELAPGEVLELGELRIVEPASPDPVTRGSTNWSVEVHVRTEQPVELDRFQLMGFGAPANVIIEPIGPAEFSVDVEGGEAIELALYDRRGEYEVLRQKVAGPADQPLMLSPQRPGRVELRVETAEGQPVEQLEVEFRQLFDSVRGLEATDYDLWELLPEGRLNFQPPGTFWSMTLRCGDQSATVKRQLPGAHAGPQVVRLASARPVRGRVSRRGEPAAGLEVALRRRAPDFPTAITSELFSHVDVNGNLTEVQVDAQGEFEVWAPSAGAFALGVLDGDEVLHVVEFDDQAADPLEIDLDRVGSLSGRVVPGGPPSAAPADLPAVAGGVLTAWNGLGVRRSVTFGADGEFLIAGLQPGRWYLEKTRSAYGREWVGTSQPVGMQGGGTVGFAEAGFDPDRHASFEVRAHEDTRIDFALAPRDGFAIRGRVRIDGVLPTSPLLHFSSFGQQGKALLSTRRRVDLSADGSFRTVLEHRDAWQASLEFSAGDGRGQFNRTWAGGLADSGELPIEFVTGQLVLEFASTPPKRLFIQSAFQDPQQRYFDDGMRAVDDPRSGANLDGILAGQLSISRLPESGFEMVQLATGTLEPGGRLVLSIP